MKNKILKRSIITVAILTALQTNAAQESVDTNENKAAEDKAIETIVVTSQKRLQRLIDVPIAVTNVGAKEISERGIQKLEDIGDAAPNVAVSQSNDFRSSVSIRGVGANSRNIGFDIIIARNSSIP